MVQAELELIAKGQDAVPILESLLSGEAKNDLGIPYRDLGLPLRCALEIISRLGPTARAVEPLVRQELRAGHFAAAQALSSFESVQEDSIIELAAHLGQGGDIGWESAAAILQLGVESHPAVRAVIEGSRQAAKELSRVKSQIEGKAHGKA
ncbi:MAG: hypothetical protein P4L83_16255 [Nevskia sp.]|nr:hypothetical protein [Nevskia sp.]